MADNCTNCGTPLLEGAAFCAECGAASPAASAPLSGPKAWPSELPAHPPFPVERPPETPGDLIYATPPDAVPVAGPGPVVERNTYAGVLGLVGALVLGVSTFLAWAQVTLFLVEERSRSVSGWDWFDDDPQTGPLLALLALAAAALAGLLLARVASLLVRVGIAALGALSLGVAFFAISDILERQTEVQSVGNVTITFQIGMWLVVVGSAALIMAGAVADHRARRPGVPLEGDLG
ncbi:MAG TPA: zinc ribbon domain-containing protein [Acidimicrobiales bacterium]|nr:zinc ribbon domain-containing protein [Acidimicrobiales bacterium]